MEIEAYLESRDLIKKRKGSGVAKNNALIHCIFCKDYDRKPLMGVNLISGAWGCWRNTNHRGKDFVKLVSKLEGVPYQQAAKIVGKGARIRKDFDFDALEDVATGKVFGVQKTDEYNGSVRGALLPESFRLFHKGPQIAKFWLYMHSRGYTRRQIKTLSDKYNVGYDWKGKFTDRILIPYSVNNNIVAWTGRSIGNSEVRYLSSSLRRGEGTENLKNLVFNYDSAERGGRLLFVCEGPMDVLKVDFFGEPLKCHAVGLSSMTMEAGQLDMVVRLSMEYDKIAILLDNGEWYNQQHLSSQLSMLGDKVLVAELPEEVKDPGDLTELEVKNLCRKVLKTF